MVLFWGFCVWDCLASESLNCWFQKSHFCNFHSKHLSFSMCRREEGKRTELSLLAEHSFSPQQVACGSTQQGRGSNHRRKFWFFIFFSFVLLLCLSRSPQKSCVRRGSECTVLYSRAGSLLSVFLDPLCLKCVVAIVFLKQCTLLPPSGQVWGLKQLR